MHPEKGTFKVNNQRLKPYFGGEFHANKQTIPLSTPEECSKESYKPGILGTLRFRAVELLTLNKALLRRQPMLFELFLSVVLLC